VQAFEAQKCIACCAVKNMAPWLQFLRPLAHIKHGAYTPQQGISCAQLAQALLLCRRCQCCQHSGHPKATVRVTT